jgi:tRNA(fMet)-specific endonuclease VapC
VIAYLLDTDTCIYLIKKKNPRALVKLQSMEIGTVGISSITLSELEYGVARSTKPQQNKLALAHFLAPLEIMPFDDQAAAQYGPIRALLESNGTPIGPLDTLIASHALALDAIIVTNNIREFARVPKLVIENWFDD